MGWQDAPPIAPAGQQPAWMAAPAIGQSPQPTNQISDATANQLRHDMPLTATDRLETGSFATPAMRPDLMQEVRASPVGEIGYGFEHTAGGLAQGAAHLFGSKERADAVDRRVAEDSRAQKLARTLTGQQFVIEHPLIPGLGNPGEMMGQTAALGPIARASGPVLQAAGKVSPYLAGALGGAEFGAIAPVNNPENYGQKKAIQVGAGAALGLAVPAAANSLTATPTPKPSIMTTDQLEKAGSAEFQKFANTPVSITPEMTDAISGRYGKAAINDAISGAEARRNYPLVNELKSLLEEDPAKLPQQISAEAADKVSRAFREGGSRAMKADEGTVGSGLYGRRNDIETALSNVPGVSDARQLWRQFEKSKIIDEAIQTAHDLSRTPGGTGGIDQSLRVQFGKIINDRDLFATFSPEEQEAIKLVRNGTFTANTLQRLGKLSPAKNHLSAMTEAGITLLGNVVAPGVGALPGAGLAATGIAANAGANMATSRSARLASELIRSGGVPAGNAAAVAPNVLNFRAGAASPYALAMARMLAAQGQ